MVIKLGKDYDGEVMRSDFKLKKVCDVEDVEVLKVNELCEGMKGSVDEGDGLNLLLSKMGKEGGEGVG